MCALKAAAITSCCLFLARKMLQIKHIKIFVELKASFLYLLRNGLNKLALGKLKFRSFNVKV